jgi:hypothetical protein
MLKGIVITIVLAMGFSVPGFMEECFAGQELSTLSARVQNKYVDCVYGKIPMTRTRISNEIPYDTQYRFKIREFVDTHLGKTIMIKVRTEQEYGKNEKYAHLESGSVITTEEDSSYIIYVNETVIMISNSREEIISAAMEQVEELKTNPENIIVVDVE